MTNWSMNTMKYRVAISKNGHQKFISFGGWRRSWWLLFFMVRMHAHYTDLAKSRILCTWTLFKGHCPALALVLVKGVSLCVCCHFFCCFCFVRCCFGFGFHFAFGRNRDICNPLQVTKIVVPISLTFNKCINNTCVLSFHFDFIQNASTQSFNSISHHRMRTSWNSIFHHAVSENVLCGVRCVVCVFKLLKID